MTRDEQEALSISLTRGLWCVPLSSGRIAIFSHPMRELHCIVESWDEVVRLGNIRPVQIQRTVVGALIDVEIDL